MSEKTECVEVTVKLPKRVYEFYKALADFRKETLDTFLTEALVDDIDGHIDDPPRGFLVKLYGLEDYSSISPKDC